MSRTILLNDEDGSFYKELSLISFPPGFVVPEGKTLRWTDTIMVNPLNLIEAIALNRPTTALFYFGSATAEVTPLDEQRDDDIKDDVHKTAHELVSGTKFVITIQSKSPSELEALRTAVIGLVTTGRLYSAVNDLNPKAKKPRIGLVGWFKRFLFGDS